MIFDIRVPIETVERREVGIVWLDPKEVVEHEWPHADSNGLLPEGPRIVACYQAAGGHRFVEHVITVSHLVL
jgi:hypothetical protein